MPPWTECAVRKIVQILGVGRRQIDAQQQAPIMSSSASVEKTW
jgi:hypothetical protein